MKTEHSKLLSEVEQFLIRHNISPSTFGTQAMADPTFVFDLRKGQDLRLSSVDRVRRFMSEYQPARPTRRGVKAA
jgi:hypothetical protein